MTGAAMLGGGFITDRLEVRDWTDDLGDAARRARLEDRLGAMLTPGVLRHLPEPLHLSGDQTIGGWIDARASESACYLLRERSSGAVIGLMLLAQTDDNPRAGHLGYLLAESAWGQGFATELVRGATEVVRAARGAMLMGGVAVGHDASGRVLQKAGFRRSDGLSTNDTDMYVFTAP